MGRVWAAFSAFADGINHWREGFDGQAADRASVEVLLFEHPSPSVAGPHPNRLPVTLTYCDRKRLLIV